MAIATKVKHLTDTEVYHTLKDIRSERIQGPDAAMALGHGGVRPASSSWH